MNLKPDILPILVGMFFLSMNPLSAAGLSPADSIPVSRIGHKRLPDMNIPRASHQVASFGDGILVVGGHTTGFVLTQTAEFYSYGTRQWTIIPTLYNHDFSFSAFLDDGSLAVGGGCDEDFGVGQTLSVEVFDPRGHTFSPLPIMERRRTGCCAANLGNGRLAVSGNWYRKDEIEIFEDGKFQTVKQVSQDRSKPYILPISDDDAIIFSSMSNGLGEVDTLATIIVDRLHGEPFTPQILQKYRPLPLGGTPRMEDFFIGDKEKGIYRHLVAALDSCGTVHLLRIDAPSEEGQEPAISLLPTDYGIPSSLDGMPAFGKTSALLVDRDRCAAYLVDCSLDERFIALKIDYSEALDGGAARLSLLRCGPVEGLVKGEFRLLGEGCILSTGGIKDGTFNYEPQKDVHVFFTEGNLPAQLASPHRAILVPAVIIAILLIVGLFALLLLRGKKGGNTDERVKEDERMTSVNPGENAPSDNEIIKLMESVTKKMEDEKCFRRKGLTITDIAKEIGTNSKYISRCVNTVTGKTFTDLVNDYRITFAQELLRANPSMKIMEVWEESGFSSEVSFFRNFKARTGKTPSQWLADLDQ